MQELYSAVRSGDKTAIQSAVAADPSLAVFAAAITGDIAALETLISGNRGLIAVMSSDGWTPLHLAAHFGQTESVRLLLNKGALANAHSSNALHNMPLHAAAAGKATDAARLLITHGGDVNARQHGGWVPLHAAAQNGDLELARLLIESGADVNIRAENQQRPLDLALTKGQQTMVELLESHGAQL